MFCETVVQQKVNIVNAGADVCLEDQSRNHRKVSMHCLSFV